MPYALEIVATRAARARDPRVLRAFRLALAADEDGGLRFGPGESADWLELSLPYRCDEETARRLLTRVLEAAGRLELMVHDPQLGAGVSPDTAEQTLASWRRHRSVVQVGESADSIDRALSAELAEKAGFGTLALVVTLALVLIGLLFVCGALVSASVQAPADGAAPALGHAPSPGAREEANPPPPCYL